MDDPRAELIMDFVKWSIADKKRLDVYSLPEIEEMVDRFLRTRLAAG